MTKPTSQNNRGIGGRQHDENGQIRQKNGATQIGTLRKTYGVDFALGSRSDMKLDTLLERTGQRSLSAYINADKPGSDTR